MTPSLLAAGAAACAAALTAGGWHFAPDPIDCDPLPAVSAPSESSLSGPSLSDPDAQRLADGIQALVHRMLTSAELPDGNLCLSPTSLTLCLGMGLLGADGATRLELAGLMGLTDEGGAPWANERIEAALATALRQCNGDGGGLSVVNDFWGQEGYAFRDSYRGAVQRAGADLHQLDFADTEAARRTVNDYIAKKTRNRILELLPRGSVDDSTRLVLTNAVYFKARWKNDFSDRATQPMPFKLPSGEAVDVPMMRQHDHFAYADNSRVQIVVLPYDDARDLEMVVVLPRADKDIAAAIEELAPKAFGALRERAQYQSVSLQLPRVEFRSNLSLRHHLEVLGVVTAFDADRAELGPMHTGDQPMFFSDVLQQTFLRVDEKGSEAAAATAAILAVGSAANPEPPIPFHVDRPYLMVIRNHKTGLNLFTARVEDPR
jgi:serpin B